MSKIQQPDQILGAKLESANDQSLWEQNIILQDYKFNFYEEENQQPSDNCPIAKEENVMSSENGNQSIEQPPNEWQNPNLQDEDLMRFEQSKNNEAYFNAENTSQNLSYQQNSIKLEPQRCERIFKRKLLTASFLENAKAYFEEYSKAEQQGKIQKNNSLRRFAEQSGYGYSTIYHLYKKWLEDPIMLRQEEALKKGFNQGRLRGKSRLTSNREEAIFRILQHNPLLNSIDVTNIMAADEECLKRGHNGQYKQVSNKSITRIFSTHKLKRTRIKLISSKRNLPDDIERRKAYCQAMMETLQSEETIYFLDQMTVNRWVGRDKAWGRQGQSFANVMINLKKQSFLIVALMGHSGSVRYEVIHGNSPQEKYELILQRLLSRPLQRFPYISRVIVIHAAVGNQSKMMMKKVAQKKGYRIIILPPFASQLNPLESWFTQIRNLLKKQKFTCDRQLIQATKKVIEIELKKKTLPNFYLTVQKYLQKGIDGENF